MKRNQLILVGLLVLLTGFISGWLAHRSITRQRIHRVAELRRAGGFEQHFFRLIQADAAQRDSLQPIVAPYAARIDSLHRGFESERRAIIRQMHQDVQPMLTTEQQQRLDRFAKRFRRHKKHRRGGKK